MSSSLRSRRMARNHRRLALQPKLNLVALMDIFTILVLFLMVNSGDVEVLQSDQAISLPSSVSQRKPQVGLTIKVSAVDIRVLGKRVEGVESVLAQPGEVIEGLDKELALQASQAEPAQEFERALGRSVTIMADETMPYKLLKRIMATCAQTDYRNIALAVNSLPMIEPNDLPETTVKAATIVAVQSGASG